MHQPRRQLEPGEGGANPELLRPPPAPGHLVPRCRESSAEAAPTRPLSPSSPRGQSLPARQPAFRSTAPLHGSALHSCFWSNQPIAQGQQCARRGTGGGGYAPPQPGRRARGAGVMPSRRRAGTLRRTPTARPCGRFPSNPDLLLRVSKKRLGVVNNKNKADFSYAFAPFSVSDDATFKIVFYAVFSSSQVPRYRDGDMRLIPQKKKKKAPPPQRKKKPPSPKWLRFRSLGTIQCFSKALILGWGGGRGQGSWRTTQ